MTITVEELKQKLDAGEQILLVDVREPFENEFASIGGVLIPLGDLPRRLSELDPSREIVTYCHRGVRSLQAASFLRSRGFASTRSLAGGITAWSEQIDPSIPRY